MALANDIDGCPTEMATAVDDRITVICRFSESGSVDMVDTNEFSR
jgi:hypothetical protein